MMDGGKKVLPYVSGTQICTVSFPIATFSCLCKLFILTLNPIFNLTCTDNLLAQFEVSHPTDVL